MPERLELTYKFELSPNPFPGFFVAIEGLDGSGSSTQMDHLLTHFVKMGLGKKCAVAKEPTDGPIGAMARLAVARQLKIDPLTLQMTFSTDRSDHIFKGGGILDILRKGKILLSDRYFASTLAYGYALGLDFDFLLAGQSKFILPDVTFFLDVPTEICIERIRESRMGFDLFEKESELLKVREGYLYTTRRLPGWLTVVDGTFSQDRVTAEFLLTLKENPKFKKLIDETFK